MFLTLEIKLLIGLQKNNLLYFFSSVKLNILIKFRLRKKQFGFDVFFKN
jgi:hypothetical protein